MTRKTIMTIMTGIALLAAVSAACSSPPEPLEEPASAGISPELREEIVQIVQDEVEAQLAEQAASRPTPVPEPTRTPQPTRIPPDPAAGICPREKPIQDAIMAQVPDRFCQEINPVDLYEIRQLQITTGRLGGQDLTDLFNLEELQVDGLREPLEAGVFSNLHNLEKLQIHTIEKPENGDDLLQPGTFRGLGKLHTLQVSSDDGWTTFKLTGDLLTGLENLETLDINYIKTIQPNALEDMRKLQNLRVHVSVAGGEVYGRVPREMFKNMEKIRNVHFQNLRWPPVLEVASREAACRARSWTSRTGGNGDHTPLSVRIQDSNRNIDLETIEGCGDEPR